MVGSATVRNNSGEQLRGFFFPLSPPRSLLLPVMSGISGRVQAVVYWPVESLHHTVSARGSQRWDQGEHRHRLPPKCIIIGNNKKSASHVILHAFCLFPQVHGQKAVWEDPVEWVRGTLPWPNAQQDQSRLFHLPPPSIGAPSEEKKPPKDTPPPSTLESDPLVSFSLRWGTS